MDDSQGDQGASGCWRHSVSRMIHMLLHNSLKKMFTFSSDFENKFVCGEIMSFVDLKEYGSEPAVKAVSALAVSNRVAHG